MEQSVFMFFTRVLGYRKYPRRKATWLVMWKNNLGEIENGDI